MPSSRTVGSSGGVSPSFRSAGPERDHSRRQWGRLSFAAVSVVFAAAQLTVSTPALAQHIEAQSGDSDALAHLTVIKNKSKNIKLDIPFADATVGSPEIADIVPISDRQLYILGKKTGTTNILLYDREKRLIGVVDVEVRMDTGNLEAQIREASGGRGIRVHDVEGTVVLSGNGEDALTVDRAMSVARGLVKDPVNALKLRSSQQVMLKVRFIEASREAARALGVRWFGNFNNRIGGVIGPETQTTKFSVPSGTFGSVGGNNAGTTGIQNNLVPIFDVFSNSFSGGSPVATVIGQLIHSTRGNLQLALSALEENGVTRTLAEPNLVALSGETAEFNAGGEFPYPVVQPGSVGQNAVVTILFKEFGVYLRFTPTVLAQDVISLKLEPRVSELDFSKGITLNGTTIPAIVQRRASTTIELRDGQSFAIAGLMQASSFRDLNEVPWLGSVPVLGALFRSSEFQNRETELVALVTPYIVKPIAPGNKDPRLKTPLDAALVGNDIDYFVMGRQEIPKSPPTYVTPTGQEQPSLGGIAPDAPSPVDPIQQFFSGLFAATPAVSPQQ